MKSSTDKLLIIAIKTLLDVAPLYGSIIIHLPRQVTSELAVAFALGWNGQHWVLNYNPKYFDQYQTPDQMAQALAHQALHLIWQHPIRYCRASQSQTAIDWGTDIAVNQYLPNSLGELPGAITLQTVFENFKQMLPARADSQAYIQVLNDLLDNDDSQSDAKHGDSHQGWQEAGGQLAQAQTNLTNIMQQAQEDAKRAGRGEVPSDVLMQVQSLRPVRRSWRRMLSLALSQAPLSLKDTHARFNRRQPYRMDLPGRISRQSAQLWIFIDNSASVSSLEVASFLAYAQQIQKQLDGQIHFCRFDARVQPIDNIKNWQRQVGGGTAFQAIFDWLLAQHCQPKETVSVIFTDGAGEKQLDSYHFNRVYWVITAGGKLSINPVIGKVIQMEDQA